MKISKPLLTLQLLICIPGIAAENTAPLSASEREDIYEKNGMTYANKLYLGLDGSPEDELRTKKAELLNFKIRDRSIRNLETYLAKSKDANNRRELMHRLSQLYEKQADVISRRTDIKHKEPLINEALRNANKHLLALRSGYPNWYADAVLFNLAENYSKLKEIGLAEKYYKDVIAKYPKSPVVADSLLSLGNMYFDRQKFQAARSYYKGILETPEQNLHPYAHYKVAWCYFNESNFSDAVAGLEKSIYESRKLQKNGEKKLGVEEEALTDLVLFFSEYGNPLEAKAYFEKIVDKEKALELRYMLARRLYEYGKHHVAKVVAKQMLDEKPQKEYQNKLYLILISVAERTKDRDLGLDTAKQLSGWIAKENLPAGDASRIESEEYLRNYSQKLHYEAETLKQKEVWEQAKKSYEIYLATFPNETETAEVKFRYAVLLMNRKEQLSAYRAVSESIARMDSKHARYKEALKLRIQTIELATKEERKSIKDSDLLAAYDAYSNAYPEEELGIEAKFKAATLAKTLEQPEQAAGRFRALAEAHPKHKLAKDSLGEALAVLTKAQKWEALRAESVRMNEKKELFSELLGSDESMKKKLAEANELSAIKITESLQSEGKFEEARIQYEKILAESPSDTMGVYTYVQLAALAEKNLGNNHDAIKYLRGLRDRYPNVKESRQALLEIARLYEKVSEPREAVKFYRDFARSGKGKLEQQALTNMAVTLDNLGERLAAAEAFFELSRDLGEAKGSLEALEAGCNNMLLAVHSNKDKDVLEGVQKCANKLAASGKDPTMWQSRAAWALDQMVGNLQASETWKKVAGKSLKKASDSEKTYITAAKLRFLQQELEQFKTLKFSKTNERPEANIGKKTKALELLESHAEAIVTNGTAKQVLSAKNVLKLAYLDFADAMESAAVPSKLTDAEKEELKKSFLTFAQEFKSKAATFEQVDVEAAKRELASVKDDVRMPDDLSREESRLISEGKVPEEAAGEIYAKKAYQLFKDGKYGEAKYFSAKWKQRMPSGKPGLDQQAHEHLEEMISQKLPSQDPMQSEF